MTRCSKARRERISSPGTMRYHAMINDRGWWYYCGCLPSIRGVAEYRNNLGPKMRKYKQWAGR